MGEVIRMGEARARGTAAAVQGLTLEALESEGRPQRGIDLRIERNPAQQRVLLATTRCPACGTRGGCGMVLPHDSGLLSERDAARVLAGICRNAGAALGVWLAQTCESHQSGAPKSHAPAEDPAPGGDV